MISNKKTARIAGLLYLGVVLSGIFSLMYVPSQIIDYNSPLQTYLNLFSFELLYRLGIISGLLCYTFFLFLPLVLYKLFKPVDENYAKSMVILAIISVPMYFLNVQNEFTVLSLLDVSTNTYGFSSAQIQSQVMLYLDQYDNGMRMIHIFSGLWLFPFGYLVFKSGFLPKILGVLLMLGCFGYLINFIGHTISPQYANMGISSYISLPASIGEIGICLWLLIMGAKNSNSNNEQNNIS
ncbi:DUF4386 domain-containing protein [Aequorivita antarctica]|uniref:DUF4386 domain-containing protein n=1 Tax=Aequorivita antarctica TaxID=153266 RepID=A0A5C6YZX2_9FLAO|nr:DUF4386 domain-containing protein [Aequorivita antarctica]TXD73261.1 DUF4386 domain-containing protein [Aequorivita antarctica]SRX76014.1 hypothetical protein AEQU3_03012 [Aequorivita antarctica]